ncbi:Zinc finger BED domain-containing protein RICESLEEPER 1 [Trametes pubescens]|uniref:Zinc finger BED domain-containing protein RICESLEEPER 1 n=1 Tax=Trametes pubescens TaxID=154538 RepID=A0A1M2V3G8_TRAPU|nr:Zinc finger BED domain-containing protein RICESLEEPER 1 [Trametes pubescens]
MSSSAGKRRARSDSDDTPPSSDNETVSGGSRRAPAKRARVAANFELQVVADAPVEAQVAVDGPVAATAAIAQDALANVQPGWLTAAQKRARFLAKYNGMTPVQILDAVSKTWRSKVYDHFKPPKVIPATTEGPNVHRFTCKIHPGIWVDRSDYEDSTGNLRRHVLKCEPAQTPESEVITAFAAGSTYSAARVRYYLALWCARHHRPFLAVEDAEFRALLRMLYGRVEIPSRVTVSRDVQLIMHHCKVIVVALFQAYPGRIHICVDGWTSPNILAFLGITAHWHHDGEIAHIILDFVRLTSSHTGKYLAEKLIECLKEFGIEEKVLSVTCDNAENNTTMLKEMHVLVPKFRGTLVRVRCFGHVLNLVVKGILSQFGRQHLIEGGDDDVDDEDAEAAQEADESREAADQAILNSLDDEELGVDVTADDIRLAAGALSKILKLSRKVWNSPTIRAELATLAADTKLNSEVLIRSVKTRWNTITEVLGRAL